MSQADRLAATVRAEMARRRVPQATVAQRLNLSQPAVSRRLCGVTEFSVSELSAVADLLGLSVSFLLGESSEAVA